MPEIDTFLHDLSSAQPAPGGGSVAALSAAMGAALLAMVCNLTIGRRRYAQVQEHVSELLSEAEALCGRARQLADEDEAAYGRVAEATRLPRSTEEEQAERYERVQVALKVAVGPPLEIMRVASHVADMASQLVGIGNSNAVSDVAVAALMADAAYRSAAFNVAINLAAINDPGWVESLRNTLAEIPDPAAAARDVERRATIVIEGRPA